MKTTTIDMSKVGDTNPFYTAVWTDVPLDEQKEIFDTIDQINKDRKQSKSL